MPKPLVSKATTSWNGTLFEGTGKVNLDSSGLGSFDLRWSSRADLHEGHTNPEELIAAAHSACFSMALANELANNGTPAESLNTGADVSFTAGEGITGITLVVVGRVPDLNEGDFLTLAEKAKKNCPVSKALKGVDIKLSASLA